MQGRPRCACRKPSEVAREPHRRSDTQIAVPAAPSGFEVKVSALGTGTAHPGRNRDKPCAGAGTFRMRERRR